MTTASFQIIETFTQVAAPDFSSADPRSQSWFATMCARLLAAHRERQAAEVDRVLRQGLASIQ
jgi:hypothetical protein